MSRWVQVIHIVGGIILATAMLLLWSVYKDPGISPLSLLLLFLLVGSPLFYVALMTLSVMGKVTERAAFFGRMTVLISYIVAALIGRFY